MKRLGFLVLIYFTVSLALLAQDSHKHDRDHDHSPASKLNSSSNKKNSDNTKLLSSASQQSNGDSIALGIDSLALLKPRMKRSEDAFHDSLPSIYAWKIDPRLGDRTLVVRDTSFLNFHQSTLVDGRDVGVSYLNNIGSPAQSKIFFDRPENTQFIFLDNFGYWRKNPGDNLFLNTKVPYSNIFYQTGGGGQSKEQRIIADLSLNYGKKINVGFNFDYLYARGFYTSLSNKQTNYNLYGSYIGDKYKMHAFVSNNNFTNSENGGITNDLFITNSQSVNDQFDGKPLSIPVRYENTWNKMRGRNIYLNNRYDIGEDTELYTVNDSTVAKRRKPDYVSPASIVFTTYYTDQMRRIHSRDAVGLQEWYIDQGLANVSPGNVYGSDIDDQMAYWSFKNTLGLSMNEGFRSWTKFGLSAFVEYDMRKYALTEVSLLPHSRSVHDENSLTIGGVLSKERGENLLFNLSAEKNVSAEDFKIEGSVTGKVKLFGKDMSAKANVYVKSIRPTFFEKRFGSKYFQWNDESLSNTKRVYIGGEITLPSFSFSKTRISGGVESVKNYIYYNESRIIQQSTKNIQIVSLRLDQDFQSGIFHWDNQIVYQMTDDDKVIPLPDFTIYTNLYITAKVAQVLSLQLGVDAHFYTKYYAPGYEPMTMQFYNQRERKIGDYPISTGYINLNLKNTRFFVMMYNLLDGVGNKDAFTTLHYPINPRMLKFGLSWKFNN